MSGSSTSPSPSTRELLTGKKKADITGSAKQKLLSRISWDQTTSTFRPKANLILRSLEMLWISSTNTARVTHENAFQFCAPKNQSTLCLKLLQRLWTQLFVPWGLRAFTATSTHICLVFHIFQHPKDFFSDLGLIYSASMCKYNNKTPTEEITRLLPVCFYVSLQKTRAILAKGVFLHEYFARIAKSLWVSFFNIPLSAHGYARIFVT